VTVGLGLAACGTPTGGAVPAATALHTAVLATEHRGTAHFDVSTSVETSPDIRAASSVSEVGVLRFAGPMADYTTLVTGPGLPSPQTRTVIVGHVVYEGVEIGRALTWRGGGTDSDFPVFGVITAQGLLDADAVTVAGSGSQGARGTTEFVVHLPGGVIGAGAVHAPPTVSPVDVHAWVGPRGVIVRVAATVRTEDPQHVEVTSTSTETLTDIGGPVAIPVPRTPVAG